MQNQLKLCNIGLDYLIVRVCFCEGGQTLATFLATFEVICLPCSFLVIFSFFLEIYMNPVGVHTQQGNVAGIKHETFTAILKNKILLAIQFTQYEFSNDAAATRSV